MTKRRVVVTGIGAVSPLGNNAQDSWQAAVAGKSGISLITAFDASAYPSQIAGQVKDFDPTLHLNPKEARRMDSFMHYGLSAALEAHKQSGLEITEENAERVGIIYGSGIGGVSGIEGVSRTIDSRGPRKVSPFHVPSVIINMVSGHFQIMTGAKGPNLATVTACAAGTHSIGQAARMIVYGDADAMMCGASEAAMTQGGMASFGNARALSTRNDDPTAASRPWDKERDGFVLADGAGALMLEEYEFAKARGANILAELIGFGMSGDAHHVTAPSPNGDGPARCMVNAMKDAGINPEVISYVNAHGTSTPLGDLAETQAVRRAFGAHADSLMVSSTKSMTGHLLGAAGSLEAVFSVLTLLDQTVAPTINLENPDPDCDLDFVPNEARKADMDVIMSNSFGFGGTNGTLIFKRI